MHVIIPHFTIYCLISQKKSDFLLWSKVVEMLANKNHLNQKGFLSILSYYASINRGISPKVQSFHPNIIAQPKPVLNLPLNLDPYWVSGFVAGDGGFSIYVNKSVDHILDKKVYYAFHITQHSKDLQLMRLFVKFFDCGLVHIRSNPLTPRCDFIVQDKESIVNKIIPHFSFYPLENLKQKDFLDFKKGMIIVNDNKHNTEQGLRIIKALSLNMNKGRDSVKSSY